MNNRSGFSVAASALIGVLLVAGCDSGGDSSMQNLKPSFVGTVTSKSYDGATDDLLTSGLGKSGLAGAAPTVASATAPTAAELRRLAIYNNYRALVDVNPNGGYGTLYGPNIDSAGADTLGEGKVAGLEYLAYADDGSGTKNVTMMVHVPALFSKEKPCIVTATSSGSRGVYGAIGTAGEWGLKRGCAVAYTDKGTGNGVHDLATNTVNLQDGVRSNATSAGGNSSFTAALSAAELAAFNAASANRIAVKHAHSQQNPEKDWGRDTLQAVRFAFYVLNEQFSDKFADGTSKIQIKPDNTIVIASSVSNGGGAAVAAAEQDTDELIDGVAVGEPNVQLPANPTLIVRRGSSAMTGAGKSLYDYFTFENLYAPCASLSTRAANAAGIAVVLPNPVFAANRCASLKAKGLLATSTTAEQAEESLDNMLNYGWQPESISIIPTMYTQTVPPITMTYSNTYGRFSVKDNLCGLSFTGVDASGVPAPLAVAALTQIFGTGNGIPPTAGIQIVNNNAPGGAVNSPISVSPSTGVQDYNIDAAICQRNLFSASDASALGVQSGISEVLRSANLHGKPAIIVHGRADGLLPVSFTSRPYFGQNKILEGSASKLTYIEVTNAQHFDAFIDNAALPGYDSRFIPLHLYFIRAMDAMWANLTQNTPLPPPQVVRTTPRGGTAGSAPALTTANVPPISNSPPEADQITFANNTVIIPD